MRPVSSLVAASCCALLACTSGETRTVALTRVMPEAAPACGAPADGRTLLVTALGDFPASEATARSSDLATAGRLELTLPLSARLLAVEVIGRGGALSARGKTAPFDLVALADGDAVPVFMAPPLSACPTGPPAVARMRPLLARAGAGALVAGGVDPQGRPVSRVERYDPATGTFEVVAESLYGTADSGLAGASITTLPGGRVVIAGGPAPAYQIYDARAGTWSAALFLGQERAFHAAVALDDTQVLLAGGCSGLAEDGTCDPAQALTSTAILDLDTGAVRDGPELSIARMGATAVREGPDAVLLAGGADPAGAPVDAAERIHPLSARPGQRIDGASASTAAGLTAGSILAAFAPAGAAPAATAAVILPEGGPSTRVRTPAAAPAPRAGATLTALQDGRVLVLGGLADGSAGALLYEPVRNAFTPLPLEGIALAPAAGVPGQGPGHGAVLLDDGTVLVTGARAPDSGPGAWPGAWIIRPDLTGPYASDATVTFGDSELARRMVPRDPAQATVVSEDSGAHYRIESSASSGLPSEWAVLAGPVFTRARIAVRARTSVGLAVLLGFRTPDAHVALILIPGQPATVLRIDQGVASAIAPCQGQVIQAAWLQGGDLSPLIEVQADTGSLEATIDGAEVLACTDIEPLPAGHVGLGVVGAAGTVLRIDSMTVRRLAERNTR